VAASRSTTVAFHGLLGPRDAVGDRGRLRERHARRRDAVGPLDADVVDPSSGEGEILRVHEALEHLATMSDRLACIVEMRYFAGLTELEIGEALAITERTVRRDWQKARLILAATLTR
jgi:DNA-directed RNA polymerase specialized sigma24 family protein